MKTTFRRTALLGLFGALLVLTQDARAFYDPNVQRWVNRDPVEEKGGICLYRFVNNAAIGQYDPFGLFLGIGYGNWCGYSRSGPGDPIDDVDAACQQHDECLATWSKVLNPFNFCRCHYQFCRAIRDADCSISPDPVGCLAISVAILAACPALSLLY